ncbi:hypothetical protein J5TS2_11910 [Brevibacillus halotolerans]|uniref:hypothetical protein n=1 Tax=Brevibacillus halotolerans TaxID=1507437 RepID=UPI001B1228C9|nr:hypothetical protein [Brevibacillus halotolerans]GIO00523.1 hypothetical protein J5TS2_11910 [Brevibacillus halotolerans]
MFKKLVVGALAVGLVSGFSGGFASAATVDAQAHPENKAQVHVSKRTDVVLPGYGNTGTLGPFYSRDGKVTFESSFTRPATLILNNQSYDITTHYYNVFDVPTDRGFYIQINNRASLSNEGYYILTYNAK